MQAVKKTASIHQIRKTEAKAQQTGRTIVTKYFVDGTKNLLARENRAMSGHRAVMLAVGHMEADDYGALLCEVWDEVINEVLVVLTRDVTGALNVMRFRDPITGEVIEQQPWKKKLNRLFPNLFIRDADGRERKLNLEEFRNIYMAFQSKA